MTTDTSAATSAPEGGTGARDGDGQHLDEVRAYFGAVASGYDDIGRRPYWQVSEAVLWRLMEILVFGRMPTDRPVRVLDAGAGTGTGAVHVLRRLPRAEAVLADITRPMLDVAEGKLAAAGVRDRADLRIFDLNRLTGDELGHFDLVISFHNVLSLLSDPAAAVRAFAAALRPGGRLALVIPNVYHALHFALRQGRAEEVDRIESRRAIRYGPDVPEMKLFSPQDIRDLLVTAGLTSVSVHGFPVSLYPMPEFNLDFHPWLPAFQLLGDGDRRSRFLDREVERCLREEAAARGNELLAVAAKPG